MLPPILLHLLLGAPIYPPQQTLPPVRLAFLLLQLAVSQWLIIARQPPPLPFLPPSLLIGKLHAREDLHLILHYSKINERALVLDLLPPPR